MKQLNVGIIGLGKIGLGYDLQDTSGVRSHTKAFLNNQNFNLILGVDLSADARRSFDTFSKKCSFHATEEIPNEIADSIEVLVIATPSLSRVSDIQQDLEKFKYLKYIVLEKPIALTLRESNQISELLIKKNLINNVFVNYMRRCNPHFIHLREIIQRKEWGDIQSIELCYPDTLINMGSHFLDLINFFFDLDFKVISKKNFEVYSNNDFKADAELISGDTYLNLYESLEKKLEMKLNFKNITIKIYDSGRKISINDDITNVDLSHYQETVLNHLTQVIQKGTPLLSDFYSAQKALVLCENVRIF